MTIKYYTLDGHDLKPATLFEWSDFFEQGPHIVAKTFYGNDVRVITIFIGVQTPQPELGGGPPIFQSRVFGGKHHGEERDYMTWDEAVAGHAALIELVKS